MWHDTTHRKSGRRYRKLLELIKELSKVAGYKINIQKLLAFLWANNKISERETKKTIPFTNASKRIKKKKNLGINVPKETKETVLKNFKTLMKEIEEHTKRWKDILCF